MAKSKGKKNYREANVSKVKKNANEEKTKKTLDEKLSIACYVFGVLLFIVGIYMLITNIIYLQNYTAGFDLTVKEMLGESIQYLLADIMPYCTYTIMAICLGRVMKFIAAQNKKENE